MHDAAFSRQTAPAGAKLLARAPQSAAGEEGAFWDSIYAGEIVRFAGGRALALLLRHARGMARRAFSRGGRPVHAHRVFNREDFFRKADKVQGEFREDPRSRELVAGLFGSLGLAPADLYIDSVELRIAPPVSTHGGGARSHVGVHRDTWGVGVQQQINWWAPLWPLSSRRTFAFYPAHWSRPIANNTATWSVRAYLDARAAAAPGAAPSYPSAPLATEDPVCAPQPALPLPGEVLCFSSAHLHSSVPNMTGLTRFSLEWRTVSAADVRAGRGAPNVDCATPAPMYRLFTRATDRTPLPEALAT